MAQITLNSTGIASSGALVLQSNGTTTAVTVSTAQIATLVNDAVVNGLTVGRGAGAVSTNTAVGASALAANTSGSNNTALGYQAALTSTTAAGVTAVGSTALKVNTGNFNTGIGYEALLANTSGANNTSVGADALYSNTTASNNSAFGNSAMLYNTTGASNTAIGSSALQANTTASNNTAVGYQAGYSNTTGADSTFLGYLAGNLHTTGSRNTLVGFYTGAAITTGTFNNFFGTQAGQAVTTGEKNTILGSYSGNQGGLDIRTASNNVVLSDGDGNIVSYFNSTNAYIVRIGTGAGSNTLKINTTTKEVTYDTSSARYKDNIRDSVYGLDAVMALRSAMFEYKKEQRTDVGLIAEEVDLVIPELVGKNADGEPDSVSYDRMVSVLVKAIQELKAEFDAYKLTHP